MATQHGGTVPPSSDTHSPPGVLLDSRTQLSDGAVPAAGWSLTAFPECGEAVVTWDRARGEPADDADRETWWSSLSECERARRNRSRAVSRARSRLRRYAVRNQLVRLVTLTYRCTACDNVPCSCGLKAQPNSRAQVKRDVNRWLVAMRDKRGGEAFPYAYVVERGSHGTRRLHVHVLVESGPLAELAATTWAHGHVDTGKAPAHVNGARASAAYLAKTLTHYVGKALHDEDPSWAHSYERSQGFNVRMVKRWRLESVDDALFVVAHALNVTVGDLELRWSDEWTAFSGPPTAAIRAP